jgi:hypothetical protein
MKSGCLLFSSGFVSARLISLRTTVPQGLPKIYSVSEPAEAAAHHEKDDEDD